MAGECPRAKVFSALDALEKALREDVLCALRKGTVGIATRKLAEILLSTAGTAGKEDAAADD